MEANSFGDKWTFTSFGESHGAAVGGVLDGVPAGISINIEMIREELNRRAGKGDIGYGLQVTSHYYILQVTPRYDSISEKQIPFL